jgi:hypothetical protein
MPFRDALGDVLDALDRAHRSAAVFMYDECHCRSELKEKPRWRLRRPHKSTGAQRLVNGGKVCGGVDAARAARADLPVIDR